MVGPVPDAALAGRLMPAAAGDCPTPVELHAANRRGPVVVWCGCGECPEPDLTPEEYRRLVDNALFEPPEYQDRLW
jgi:hypothetical protein